MAGETKRILFFSKSAGFEHDTVKRGDAAFSPVEQQLQSWCPEHGYEVLCTKDGSLFTADFLAGFDAFCFCTTGNLAEAGHDGQPPFPAGGKEALLAAIAAGKGFLAVHNGSDTFHGDGVVDPYIAMLGGEFLTHGAQQDATQELVDPHFPSLADLPASFVTHDEWYCQKNYAADLHVVLLQSTAGMTGAMYEGQPSYPAVWARRHGHGRVFYISMGHRPDNWAADVFLTVFKAGLDWATGRTEADVTPNVAQVAPGVATV